MLDNDALRRSAVVANCAMNRERHLTGPNSYTRELGFNPLDRLTASVKTVGTAETVAAWLDLCCGTGRALVQAADQLRQAGRAEQVALVGVDLVDTFQPTPAPDPPLRLICADLTTWTPDRRFDLITCVHGLHYLGDKLALLRRAAGWLTDDGLFVADLDLASIRLPDGRPAGRSLSTALRQAGFGYDPRRHRITCTGHRTVALPYTYLGADDHAGPNYTNQPAVNAYYRRHSP
jgi:SAM-dependent methyltransferase